MARQLTGAPTAKVLAASLAAFLIGALTPQLQAWGVTLSPEDVEHATSLVESILSGVITMAVVFATSYFKSPGEKDGITAD